MDAGDKVHELLAEVDATGGRSLAKEHMTFFNLATYFEKQYLKPAEYVDGRKVAGVRSISPAMAAVKALKENFGQRQLRGITHSDIRSFRAERLATKTKAGRQRSVAAVNRELEKLRRLLNIAEREGWILRNPMRSGDSLISVADDFQRLRGIRQLGTVNMVYPTALHSRFDHSLGTLAMADRMIRAIRNNTHSTPEEQHIGHMQVALTRLYALLHDLPHVPFGHTIEDELSIFTRHDKNPARISRFFGEASQVGALIIAHLGEDAYRRFIAIYTWDENTDSPLDNDDNFVYDIVSNTVCADLLDYLARDSYFCNLEIPLDYRFLNFIYLGRDAKNLKRVFVRLWKKDKHQPRRDTLTGLAGLLEARYLVAERAYFHHAKIISGAMLGRALQESSLSGEISEEDLYELGDDTLLHRLSESQNPICAQLAKNLIRRHLYKGLRKFTKADFDATQEQDHDQNALNTAYLRLSDPNSRRSLEDQLAAEIGASPGDVILYSPDKRMNLKAAKMKVLWQGNPKSLSQIDDKIIAPKLKVILDAHEMLWGIHVICSTELSERQKELLSTACEIEFLCNSDKKAAKLHKYYEDLVELHLVEKNMDTLFSSAEFLAKRSDAALALVATANDSRPWSKRIDDVVMQFFGETKGTE